MDGDSLVHRAYHAYATAPEPRAVRRRNGLYGFAALLAACADKTGASAVVVGFDCRTANLRRERYPAYKEGRTDKDPLLVDLLADAPAMLADVGAAVRVEEGWEADDVCGSAAAAARAAGWRCTIATSDRDAFGLVSDTTTVLRLRSGMDNAVEVDPAQLRAQYKIGPAQYVQFAALRGDTSDNLPGVRGIGPAKAAVLLRHFPTVEEAVADPIGIRSVLGPQLGQILIDDLADDASVFRRNIDLMTIRCDLTVVVDDCRPRVAAAQIERRLLAWDLGAVVARLCRAIALRPDDQPPPPTDADAPARSR